MIMGDMSEVLGVQSIVIPAVSYTHLSEASCCFNYLMWGKLREV